MRNLRREIIEDFEEHQAPLLERYRAQWSLVSAERVERLRDNERDRRAVERVTKIRRQWVVSCGMPFECTVCHRTFRTPANASTHQSCKGCVGDIIDRREDPEKGK